VLLYLLFTKLVHWTNNARRLTAFHTLLYYGSLGLFIFPVLLYLGNFIFNMVADRHYGLFELNLFGTGEDKTDLLGIIWRPYLFILFTIIVFACLQLFGENWRAARPRVRVANALIMLLFVPLPQITCAFFTGLYYKMAQRELAATSASGVVPLSRFQFANGGLAPIQGFGRIGDTPDFVSHRIHCMNTGQRPVYLRRDATISGEFGPGAYIERDASRDSDAMSDSTSWSSHLTFSIADWKEDPDADVLVLRPGESTWIKLQFNADEITADHGDLNCIIHVSIPFDVVGQEDEGDPDELKEDWWLAWRISDRDTLMSTAAE